MNIAEVASDTEHDLHYQGYEKNLLLHSSLIMLIDVFVVEW